MMTIAILGRPIKVQYVTALDMAYLSKDETTLGFYSNDTIYLTLGLDKANQRRILIHELAHVILTVTGLTHLLKEDLEEAICDAMEALSVPDLLLLLSKM